MEDANEIDAIVAGSTDPLVTADIGDVRVIALNRPAARNAMTRAMRQQFASLVADAEADDGIRSLIVTGAGGIFSAGVDIKDQLQYTNQPIFRPHPGEVARSCVKPIIAAVDGPCVTGGMELALSCSFIVASDRARFVDTHAKIGFFPAWGLSAMLPRTIGLRRARQMAITGEFVEVERALAWGLVNEIVPVGRLLSRCLEIAAAISRCDRASVEAQLALLNAADGLPFAQAIEAEDEAVARYRAHKAESATA